MMKQSQAKLNYTANPTEFGKKMSLFIANRKGKSLEPFEYTYFSVISTDYLR